MNEFVPCGFLTLKKTLEYFGQLKHGDEWEAEKASSKQEIQQLLFEETVSAKLFVAGRFLSFESSIWGGGEAEYIFASGWATIRGGNEYFPAEVHGRVLVEQASIDALFDGDSDDPSQSPEALSDGAPLTEVQKDAPLVDETTQDRYKGWWARCVELRGAHSNNLTSIANQIAKEDLGVDRMTPEAESKANTIRRRLTKIQKHGPNF